MFANSTIDMKSYSVILSSYFAGGVRVDFRGEEISEHGLAILTNIHTNNGDALQCLTARRDCCSSTQGSWVYPNGSEISTSSDSSSQMFVTRGSGVVRLHRKPWDDGTGGIYQCKIPDESGILQIIHIGLYPPDNGTLILWIWNITVECGIVWDSVAFMCGQYDTQVW